MAYAEYPKFMKHPQHRPAVLSKDEIVNGKVVKAPPGQPERFPDVIVNNKDQEIDYASKGYAPNGTSDPDAYMRAITGNDELPGHHHHEYPKFLYQAHEDGEMKVDIDGDTVRVTSVLVDDEKAEKKLKGEWHPNPGAAVRAALDEEEPPVDSSESGEGEGGDGAESNEGGEPQKNRGGRPKKVAE
nr:hypothetical protein HUO10_003324 [Paraburkholderia busanensis]